MVLARQNSTIFPHPELRGGKLVLTGTFLNKMFWAASLPSADAGDGDGSNNTRAVSSMPCALHYN